MKINKRVSNNTRVNIAVVIGAAIAVACVLSDWNRKQEQQEVKPIIEIGLKGFIEEGNKSCPE